MVTMVSCTPLSKLYVKFGQSQDALFKLSIRDSVIRICFDRKGMIYPTDLEIGDRTMKKNYALLENLYDQDQDLFHRVLGLHQLPEASTIKQLQEKLLEETANQIKESAKGNN